MLNDGPGRVGVLDAAFVEPDLALDVGRVAIDPDHTGIVHVVDRQ
jgi:hypothetical protein